ncbi:hypothetical protein ACFQX6_02530 [Streptosporangium lutulentum]
MDVPARGRGRGRGPALVRRPLGGGLAQGFYGRYLGGELPAEVLRSLRCQSPATLAAYQFYGHPSLRLSRSQPGA